MNKNNFGIKLNKGMIAVIMNKILETNNREDQIKLMWVINSNIEFDRFKNIDEIIKNRVKFEKILSNQSAFESNIGLFLMQFFNLTPKRTIIYEDLNKSGRTIKERIDDNQEKFLSFIPIFNKNSEDTSVDLKIKQFDKLAINNYDVIEGRYFG